MQLIDPAHPFYRPLWRRIAIVGVAAAWFLFELLVTGSGVFIPIAAAATGYSAWVLLLNWPHRQP